MRNPSGGTTCQKETAAVRVDAAIARHTLPPSRLVSGLVYDVNTGLIEIVDPATGE
jgi:hypothetical protein